VAVVAPSLLFVLLFDAVVVNATSMSAPRSRLCNLARNLCRRSLRRANNVSAGKSQPPVTSNPEAKVTDVAVAVTPYPEAKVADVAVDAALRTVSDLLRSPRSVDCSDPL